MQLLLHGFSVLPGGTEHLVCFLPLPCHLSWHPNVLHALRSCALPFPPHYPCAQREHVFVICLIRKYACTHRRVRPRNMDLHLDLQRLDTLAQNSHVGVLLSDLSVPFLDECVLALSQLEHFSRALVVSLGVCPCLCRSSRGARRARAQNGDGRLVVAVLHMPTADLI